MHVVLRWINLKLLEDVVGDGVELSWDQVPTLNRYFVTLLVELAICQHSLQDLLAETGRDATIALRYTVPFKALRGMAFVLCRRQGRVGDDYRLACY